MYVFMILGFEVQTSMSDPLLSCLGAFKEPVFSSWGFLVFRDSVCNGVEADLTLAAILLPQHLAC